MKAGVIIYGWLNSMIFSRFRDQFTKKKKNKKQKQLPTTLFYGQFHTFQ